MSSELHYPETEPQPQRLLYSRTQASQLLGGLSLSSLVGLEKRGALTPIRPTGKPTGRVFYAAEQIHSLAAGHVPDLPKPIRRRRVVREGADA